MPREARTEFLAVPYVLDDGEGEVIRWFGDTITVKSAGPKFDVAVVTAVAGSELPVRVNRRADEAVYVLEGSLEVLAGDETLAASVGAFIFLPQGVPHTFSVRSGSARLVVVTGPSGSLAMYSDVEERFGSREMPARPRDADLAVVAPVLEEHGVTVFVPTRATSGLGAASSRPPELLSRGDARPTTEGER